MYLFSRTKPTLYTVITKYYLYLLHLALYTVAYRQLSLQEDYFLSNKKKNYAPPPHLITGMFNFPGTAHK